MTREEIQSGVFPLRKSARIRARSQSNGPMSVTKEEEEEESGYFSGQQNKKKKIKKEEEEEEIKKEEDTKDADIFSTIEQKSGIKHEHLEHLEIKMEEIDDLPGITNTNIKIEEANEIKQEESLELCDSPLAEEYSLRPVNPYVPVFSRVKFFETYQSDSPGPAGWREIYARVKEMRAHTIAPVDTMGCERLPEKIYEETSKEGVSPAIHRFQLLVSLLLSSQTKDAVTAAAVAALRAGLRIDPATGRGGLTVGSVLMTPESEIDGLICKVGFHRRKAGYLLRVAQQLREKHGDDIPETLAGIVGLPGVGPKMGHLLVQRAWGRVEGIGVDVHVHRLSRQWGWVKKKKNSEEDNDGDPEATRAGLEEWLPQGLWLDINPQLVGFGQTLCPSRGKRCGDCLISGSGLCRADTNKGGGREKKNKNKNKKNNKKGLTKLE